MDYKELCSQVQKIARKTGTFIRDEREKISDKDIEFKGQTSLVTYVDKTAESTIVSELKKLIPESGFITEEGTASHQNEKYKWIIDPLDGTTNYLHGLNLFSVSIALMEENQIVLGVVYEVMMDELFYAWKDGPAFLNGNKIKVATASESKDTLIATGFPYYDFEKVDAYISTMKELMKETRGLRRMGSAAVDLSYVACGRFDAFFEHSLHSWDVAAGVFIVQQAGGKVSDFNGGENWLFGGEMVAASSNYFDNFFGIINKYLGKR